MVVYIAEHKRLAYVKEKFSRHTSAFTGDGLLDASALSYVELG